MNIVIGLVVYNSGHFMITIFWCAFLGSKWIMQLCMVFSPHILVKPQIIF